MELGELLLHPAEPGGQFAERRSGIARRLGRRFRAHVHLARVSRPGGIGVFVGHACHLSVMDTSRGASPGGYGGTSPGGSNG